MINGRCDLESGNPSTYVCGSVDRTLLFCQVISHEQMIKGTCDLVSQSYHLTYHCVKFNNHRYCGSGNIMFLFNIF